MLRKIILFLLPGLFIFGAWKAYGYYLQLQEKKRTDEFYKNIKDTSSPTVTVLRDSISIGYQNSKRTIHIYVPPEYEKDSTSRYPVMYFLDGESCFNDLANESPEWQVDEVINAASENGGPTAIVVGIEEAEDRDAEYTPWMTEYTPKAHGENFAKWLSTDLKSWVDSTYRTMPEATATSIGGISRSGMMAYYMFMAFPDVFGKTIIQSPSMWVDREKLLALELSNKQLEGKKIFISVGEREGGIMIPDAKRIYKKFKNLGLGDDQLRLEIIEGEGHWHFTWRKSFALAYPWLFNQNQNRNQN